MKRITIAATATMLTSVMLFSVSVGAQEFTTAIEQQEQRARSAIVDELLGSRRDDPRVRSDHQRIVDVIDYESRTVSIWPNDNSNATLPRIEYREEVGYTSSELSPEAQAEMEYWHGIWSSPEVLAMMDEIRAESLRRLQAQDDQATPRISWHILRNFRYFGQQEWSTCGPASVRMAIHQLGRPVPSEWDILRHPSVIDYGPQSNGGRTILPHLVNYIRQTAGFSYNYVSSFDYPSRDRMAMDLGLAIGGWGIAPIVGINGWNMNWPTPVEGHFIVLDGALLNSNLSGSAFDVADPWGGLVGVRQWERYTVTMDLLHRAFTNNRSMSGYAW